MGKRKLSTQNPDVISLEAASSDQTLDKVNTTTFYCLFNHAI